jgi:hypothetical protein
MTRGSFGFATSIFCLTITPAMAQWSNVRTRGVPRTGEGKVDMSAAAPRTSQGKPDLSGIWQADKESANEDLSDGLKNDFPIQPWAEELAKKDRLGQQLTFRPHPACPREFRSLRSRQQLTPSRSFSSQTSSSYSMSGSRRSARYSWMAAQYRQTPIRLGWDTRRRGGMGTP